MESHVGPVRTKKTPSKARAAAQPYVPRYMRATKASQGKKRRQPSSQPARQQVDRKPRPVHKAAEKAAAIRAPNPHVQSRPVPQLKARPNPKPIAPPPNPKAAPAQPPATVQSSHSKMWSLNDFKMGRRVGQGVMADVYIAKEKTSGRVVAVKAISRRTIKTLEEQFQTGSNGIMRQIKREIEIHSHTRHPNILRMYGYFYDDKNIYLVLEYADEGELRHALKDQPEGKFPEEQVASFAKQVASALEYLHSKGVLHRDLKSENLLLMKNGTLRLNDFGWAVHSPKMDRTTFCGTLDYLPPEIVREEPYSKSADMWSLGVLIYELITGVMPFETENPTETYARILQPDEHLQFPDYMSDDAKDLVSRLLVVRPAKRLNANQVLGHPWIMRAGKGNG